MDQSKIGSFLKKLRRERNLTQEELAEKLNVSGRTVSRWETGANMPDISLLVELAEFYDVSIPEIINGERKSEIMNEEVKETARSLSDYAEAINKRLKIVCFVDSCCPDWNGSVCCNRGIVEYTRSIYEKIIVLV